MKSLQITGPEEFRIVEIDPPACGADEVLIEIKACTICNQHDLSVFGGHPQGGRRHVASRTFTVHLKSYGLLPHVTGGQVDGYVLVGVPPEHNRELLAETLAVLVRESPAEALHVNLESAVESIPVTPKRPGWRDEWSDASRRLLERYGLADPADAPSARQVLSPWAPRKDMPLAELLSLEDRLVRTSAAQARILLNEALSDLRQ